MKLFSDIIKYLYWSNKDGMLYVQANNHLIKKRADKRGGGGDRRFARVLYSRHDNELHVSDIVASMLVYTIGLNKTSPLYKRVQFDKNCQLPGRYKDIIGDDITNPDCLIFMVLSKDSFANFNTITTEYYHSASNMVNLDEEDKHKKKKMYHEEFYGELKKCAEELEKEVADKKKYSRFLPVYVQPIEEVKSKIVESLEKANVKTDFLNDIFQLNAIVVPNPTHQLKGDLNSYQNYFYSCEIEQILKALYL